MFFRDRNSGLGVAVYGMILLPLHRQWPYRQVPLEHGELQFAHLEAGVVDAIASRGLFPSNDDRSKGFAPRRAFGILRSLPPFFALPANRSKKSMTHDSSPLKAPWQ